MIKANLPQTASLLNVSPDTVRRRLRSGSLVGERDERGHWHIELPDSMAAATEQQQTIGMATPLQVQDGTPELVQALRDQIEDLSARLDRSEAERKEDKEKAAAERARLLALIDRLAVGTERKPV